MLEINIKRYLKIAHIFSSVMWPLPRERVDLAMGNLNKFQFSSVAQSCPTLCDPMDCSTPGLPVPHQLLAAAAAAKSLQSCPTLCDPIDSSPPGSPVPGILQARTLEWVAIAFSNAWKWKVKMKSLSCVRLFATPWTAAYQAPPSMGFSRQEYWSGMPSPSLTNSQSLLKLMSIESVMPSNHLILCRPLPLRLQSFPASRSFQMSQFFASDTGDDWQRGKLLNEKSIINILLKPHVFWD